MFGRDRGMKYKAIILRQEQDNRWFKFKEMTLNPEEHAFNYDKGKSKSSFFSLKGACFTDGKTTWIFYNWENGAIMTFNEIQQLMTPEEINSLIVETNFAKLARAIKEASQDVNKISLLRWVFIFGVGAVLGWFAHGAM